MHIAHVISVNLPRSYGGLARWLACLGMHCKRRGHRVSIVWEGGQQQIEEFKRNLAEADIESVVMPARGRVLRFSFKLRGWLKSQKVDIVHGHFGPAGTAALAAGRSLRLPTVYTFHSGGQSSSRFAGLRISLASRAIFVSRGLQEEFAAAGLSRPKCRFIYLGTFDFALDADRGNARRSLGLAQDDLVVACSAFHRPEKGVDMLLRAMAILAPGNPRLRLLQFGDSKDPSETQALRRLSSELGLDDRVTWAGFRDDLSRLLQCADVYCQPSRREGLPLAILEAMMAALPVVAFDVGGIKEAVLDQQTGLMASAEDVSGLAQQIQQLLHNIPMRQAMGQAGRQRARTTFDMNRLVEQVTELYEDILAERLK